MKTTNHLIIFLCEKKLFSPFNYVGNVIGQPFGIILSIFSENKAYVLINFSFLE